MKQLIFSLLLISLITYPLFSFAAEDTKLEDIINNIDELYRSSSSSSLVEMEIITPHWQRTLKMKIWSKGTDKTFLRILEPKKEKGMGTLRVGNEMWNFLPKSNKVMKIPPSMMMGSWMGSDLTNDDLVKEFTFIKDYDFELYDIDKPQAGMIYVKCVPHDDLPVVWGHIIIAVQEKDNMPVWENYYDENGKLMRELFFKDIKKFGNREMPAVMELIPTNKKGRKTILRYLEAEFDIKLDNNIFTLRNLRTRI